MATCGKTIKFIRKILIKGFDKGIIIKSPSIASLFYYEPRSVSEASDFIYFKDGIYKAFLQTRNRYSSSIVSNKIKKI